MKTPWRRQQGLCVNVTVESQTNICFIMNVIIISITNALIKVEVPFRVGMPQRCGLCHLHTLPEHSLSKGMHAFKKSHFTQNITY